MISARVHAEGVCASVGIFHFNVIMNGKGLFWDDNLADVLTRMHWSSSGKNDQRILVKCRQGFHTVSKGVCIILCTCGQISYECDNEQ